MAKGSAGFEGLLDGYFESYLEQHPMAATYAGLPQGEGQLGRSDPAFEAQWLRRNQKTLAALERISPSELSPDQHLDRLAFRSQLLREVEDHLLGRSGLDPRALDEVLHILLHELQRTDEPERAARNIRSLLPRIPAYLAGSLELLRKPEPVWRGILEKTAAGAPALFRAVENFLRHHKPRPAERAGLAGAEKACRAYADQVLDLPLAAEGSFAVGRLVLERRVRDQLGLDYSLGEIETLALAEIERIKAQLEKACARFGRNKTPESIIEKARSEWDPGSGLLELYKKETRRVADAFRAARAVSFPPGETLEVRPVPEFMRHLFPTAAYSSPGPFAKKQRGIFWVNDLSVTRTREAEKKAERQQHFGLSLTCAHEAYPGHHLQFTTANRHPRKWRRLFAHAVFYEGWTLWCEQMMVDLEIDRSPWLPVQQLHDALWRAHRILVDLRLQTRRYHYSQAVRHLQRALGFTRARAEADVNWYTGSPTVPMSYWLGRLENERLRRKLMVGRGWSLQQFNDWLLGSGTLPQAWMEKYALG